MLLGNYSVLNKGPGRAFGGSTVADSPGNWGKSGASRGMFAGGVWAYAGVPLGYRPPSSWVIPQKSGAVASQTQISGSGSVTSAQLAGGKNLTVDMAGVAALAADLGLIVPVAADLTGAGVLTGDIFAALAVAADLTGSGTLAGDLGALAGIVAALTGAGVAAVDMTGKGDISAAITPFADLSPQSLASAVWEELHADHDDPATYGGAVRFLYHLAHHKVVTDPTAGTITVYDDDGSTVLFVADLFEDDAGSQPYRGSGAERRDEFN